MSEDRARFDAEGLVYRGARDFHAERVPGGLEADLSLRYFDFGDAAGAKNARVRTLDNDPDGEAHGVPLVRSRYHITRD